MPDMTAKCDAERNGNSPAANIATMHVATMGNRELVLCQHHTGIHGPKLIADGWTIAPFGQPVSYPAATESADDQPALYIPFISPN